MEIKYNTHNSCTMYIHLNIFIHLHTKIPGIAIHCFLGERAEAAIDHRRIRARPGRGQEEHD